MAVSIDHFADAPLAAAEQDEDYNLYKAALEWRLTAPIVIRSADDIVSADRWRDLVQPFHHQVRNLITFCRLAPSVLIADEVGLGKTISAGLILSELVARRRVSQALVICPRVLCEQWVAELDQKFRMKAIAATGSELLDACDSESPVVVTTYESASRYLSHPKMPTDTFQMLILDEAHRLRNLHGTASPPRLATAIKRVIEDRWFTYVLMLTATPIQTRFTDIYSLIDLLTLSKGHRNPFGDLQEFRTQYLVRGSEGRRLLPNMKSQLRQILNNYVTRTRRVDADLAFPSREVQTIPVRLTGAERECEVLVKQVFGKLKPLQQTSLGQSLMSSPAAMAAQLEKVSVDNSRFAVAARNAQLLARKVASPAKLKRLLSICDELSSARQDWRLLVFTQRLATLDMIYRCLEAKGIAVGLIAGGRRELNLRDISAFMRDPPGIHVLVSTEAGAEGINLQASNVLVNYDLPWNPMLLEQRIGRIQRLGSRHQSVHVINLVAKDTVEEQVVVRLLERLMMVGDTVGDLESILAGIDNRGEERSGERFETLVRELVVKSLRGQDMERATLKHAANIESARREYDSNYGQMNRDLGVLDATASGFSPPPVFDRTSPSLSAVEFVRRAMAAEGRVLKEISNGVYEEEDARSRRRKVAFSLEVAERTAGRGQVTVYAPGQPAFERLIERWAERRSHRIIDLRDRTAEAATVLAQSWCEDYPEISFSSCNIRSPKAFINGRVLVRTTAENRVDQHQRLIEQSVTPPAHHVIPHEFADSKGVLLKSVSLTDISPRAAFVVQHALTEDQEINRFSTYYASRRINELSRAGENPHLCQRIEDDFSVTVGAEVVGFRGACYEEALIDIEFTVRGHDEHTYVATLQAVPLSGQIIEQPISEIWPDTGTRLPFGVLAQCDRAGAMILKHLLRISEYSGRLIAEEFVVRCELTGMLVCDDEIEQCDVTGQRAVTSEFVTCSVSGSRLLKSESRVSDFSGVIVRNDLLKHSERPPHRQGTTGEMVHCELTGRHLLRDEVGKSAVSQRLVDSELLTPSEKSGRLGLTTEIVRCEHTGRELLEDEVGVCSVTGQRVDVDSLARSEVSGRMALAVLFDKCQVSGRRAPRQELERCSLTSQVVAPDLLETCVISGHRMLRQQMRKCVLTEEWLSPDVASRSDFSGDYVRPDLVLRSERSPFRTGLPNETALCEISGRRLLHDELARSIVSNRLIDRELMVGEADRLAHPSELVTCEVSGRTLFPDQTAICSVTQQRVAFDLLVHSAVSDRLVLTSEAARCAVSGVLAANDELETCSLTGSQALPGHLATCAETGVRGLKRVLVKCADTEAWLVPDAAEQSDYRKRHVQKRLLSHSEKPPHRLGTKDEFGICETSGKSLLLDELDRCSVTNQLVDKDLLIASDQSGRLALPDNMTTCEAAGARVLLEETGLSAVSGKRVAVSLLVESPVSGRQALPEELAECEITHCHVLPDELLLSSVSGKRFREDQAINSAVSDRVGHQSEAVRCEYTDRLLLIDEVGRSDLSGKLTAQEDLRASEVTGRLGVDIEISRCQESGVELLVDELGRSVVSNLLVDKRLLLTSSRSGRMALERELVTCEVSGRKRFPDEVGRCAITREQVDLRLMEPCEVTGRLALKDQLERCAVTNKRVLPSVLEECQLTEQRVVPSELETCVRTGVRGVRGKMYRSELSGRWVVRKHARRCAVTKQILASDEVTLCHWNDVYVLKSEMQVCKRCGLSFYRGLINSNGEFRYLRKIALAQQEMDVRQDLVPWLRQQLDGRLRAATDAWSLSSRRNHHAFLFVNIERAFGLYTRTALVVIAEGDPPTIVGDVTVGKSGSADWSRV